GGFPTDMGQRGGDMPWKAFPLEGLPSSGMFYPHSTTIDIRAADAGEVRHFSTIDENDPLDVDDKLNVIMDKCVRIKFPNKTSTWKDLKEEDRFCLIFAVREITFINGENKLYVPIKCGATCNGDRTFNEKVELRKENFEYYKIDPKLMRKYSEEQRCFIINNPKLGPEIRLYVPSLGVTNFIKNLMRDRIRKGDFYDETFLKLAPYFFSDWRMLNDTSYKRAEQDSFGWGNKRLSAILKLVDMIRFGVKTEMKKNCSKCGAEVAAPLTFPGGVKSLFLYTDDIDEILG
ncbi:MAG: hypothetical protein OK454_01065, partial [Thaumarchaeota archaeon]|nr:hypothetical protein [Nitrososphaerota archaeon]